MKKVLILANNSIGLYNFRFELIQELIKKKYEVYFSIPEDENDEKVSLLLKTGADFIHIPMNRRGINPVEDLKLINSYKKVIKEIQPDIVLTYTIKPNIYGGLIAKKNSIPYISNITGLGTALEKSSIIQKITTILYRLAFSKIHKVFFQNKENMKFFIDKKIALGKHELIPGSGVNLVQFKVLVFPSDETIEFVFISRIMKEKGIEQYIEAANYITLRYPNTRFHVCGFCEEDYEDILNDLHDNGVLTYHGMVEDIREILKRTHCTIHPTYYPEGMSNVLLESAASGRPIITTNRSGCKEIIDDGVNGYIIEQQNSQDLINKIEKFLNLNYEEKRQMGLAGRRKVEKEFDRQIVVDAYIEEINQVV